MKLKGPVLAPEFVEPLHPRMYVVRCWIILPKRPSPAKFGSGLKPQFTSACTYWSSKPHPGDLLNFSLAFLLFAFLNWKQSDKYSLSSFYARPWAEH